jgi:glutathione synthase/RimK-type ligase-like ATP-grasp enzyme
MEPATLPQHIASVCVKAARDFGLVLSGIDLRETSEGEYYCFEVNGFPGFDYYERRTGQPISAALAEHLSSSTFL